MPDSASPSPSSDAGVPAIRLVDIDKSFGPVHANRGAQLEVAGGEIHALVGENGAGKSTLMRVLAGMYAPNAGRMFVDGRDVTGWSTSDAIAAGVGMVHQHFMLVPTLTVAENVMLGSELTRGPSLDRSAAIAAVKELSERTGLAVPPDALVSDLSVGQAQRVEILKTLYRGAKILILDEPTAVLSPPEVRELWDVLRSLRKAGGTIVLITHKLDEVIDVSDAITVMRRGATVARMATQGTTPQDIARAMVGRDVALALDADYSSVSDGGGAEGPPLLDVRDLRVAGARRAAAVDGVSFTIAPGEILGIAGVEGNGQTELVEAIAGLARASGVISLAGRDLMPLDVRARGDAGLSHIPEDRHERGLILDEPTAVLSPPEVRELWAVLRSLKAEGSTIVLITHKLDEVIDVSETITVMRAGKTVARMPTAGTTPQSIARAMVGRDVALALDAEYSGTTVPELGAATALLEVRDLRVLDARGRAAVDGVSFSVAPGEILGIAGVEGNGQTELIEAIAGLRGVASGSITLASRDLLPLNVRRRGDAGLSHIPEDRHERALILDYSVAENLILGQQHRFMRGVSLDRRRMEQHAADLIEKYDIRPRNPQIAARALSGGNQQKIVVAREMARDFKVLLAAQPTRGVDVGAIEFIHAQLRGARDAGKAVLLVSADLAEVLALSDRVAVMYGGKFVALLPRSEASPDTLGPYMTGAERAA